MEEEDRRELLSIIGVTEDDGLYVLIAGFIFLGLTVVACCYCKVYDPIKTCVVKGLKKCKKKPKEAKAPPPDAPQASERKHWYLNKTLAIDRKDRDELGPVRNIKGLQGGWYGAHNGGFNA